MICYTLHVASLPAMHHFVVHWSIIRYGVAIRVTSQRHPKPLRFPRLRVAAANIPLMAEIMPEQCGELATRRHNSAPWLSWSRRPTVSDSKESGHRKIESSSLSGAEDLFFWGRLVCRRLARRREVARRFESSMCRPHSNSMCFVRHTCRQNERQFPTMNHEFN
ncbi:hypothetical protein BDN70DRAFT_882855, partial [Pholiota conissans]